MLGAFERLGKSVLRRLGQDALLISGRNSTPCRAVIEHGVQVSGGFNDAVYERDVATLAKSVGARTGDRLEHPCGNYILDGMLQDNGATTRYTLQAA